MAQCVGAFQNVREEHTGAYICATDVNETTIKKLIGENKCDSSTELREIGNITFLEICNIPTVDLVFMEMYLIAEQFSPKLNSK